MRSQHNVAATYEPGSAYKLTREQDLRIPSLLRCGLMIVLVKVLLKIRGFGPTIHWIQRRATVMSIRGEVDDETINVSERNVALACALYPGRAQCLERSLVLYYLLRRQGVDLRFVNGVKVDPFAAHAWIEYRGRPLNDVAEHVALYTPLVGDDL
jgi:hypothetical protein